MAKQGQGGRLDTITEAVRASGKGLPPVHLWNPPYCGEIDMRIGADGTWYYQKTPIGRPALVRLFASILKREGERYYLVTPVEKCGIAVDDAPFVAVEVNPQDTESGRRLRFRTNVDEEIVCDREHPLRFEPQGNGGLKPYLHVRRDLWALATRPVYYDLVELGEERSLAQGRWFGVASQGEFFPMVPAEQLEDLAE
jgi:uncharacterized protein